MHKKSLEDLTEVFYPQVSLPPLWQVIYHEAMRGNHLLFKRSAVLESPIELYPLHVEDHQDHIVQIVVDILNCYDIKSMSAIIDSLSQEIYQKIYLVYLRLLAWGREYVKLQLN